MRRRLARGDVVEETSNRGSDRQVRTRAYGLDVGIERRGLIADEMELNIGGIRTSRSKHLGPEPREIDLGRTAIGVVQDRDAIDLKLVDRFNERTKDVGGDSGAGIAHDMDIANLKTKDRQRVDAAIHAGDYREVLSRNSRK